jgi:protein phosphatase
LTGFDEITHHVRSDVGVRRSHNQDAYAEDPAADPDRFAVHGHLFLVADGMGGHAVGEKASAKAVRDIPHTFHKHAAEGAAAALRKAFTEANAGIHAVGQENPEFRGLGTTATAILLRPEGAWVGHVGDSRAYRIRDAVIEQLTFDHSAVWEIARRQRVNPEDLQGIRSNVILRSLGPEAAVEVDVEGPHPVRPGDIYLLCSDGLTGQLSDYEIGAVASALPPDEACEFLVELGNLRGGPDNITVLIIRVGGSPEPVAIDATAPRPKRRQSIPWPLTTLALGIVLAVTALALIASDLPGGRQAFVLAIAAIGAGLFGLGLHAPREARRAEAEPPPPELHIYRNAHCRIERPLLDKLIKAENELEQRLPEIATHESRRDYEAFRGGGEKAREQGDLQTAFREHCRAMQILLRIFNARRHKEEVFQPVWDKDVGGSD